ncbi:MAG: Gfo/Idh/MocA family protein [Jatrophihabitans sp.]
MTRFGLIGTGHWARGTHAAALAAHPEVDLVGIWGRRPEAATALAADFGVRVYPDPDSLIADVDAVAFAVPPDVQAAIAIRAATAGRHLLLDKPIALDPQTADRLVAAADAGGVRSVVFFTRRFIPETAAWIAGPGAEPGWVAADITMHGSIFGAGSPHEGSRWRKENGALWDMGPHALSMTVPVLGAVDAVVGVRGHGDTVGLTCRHAWGGVSTVLLSLTAPPAGVASRMVFYGAAGVADLTGPADAVAAYRNCVSALLDPTPSECDVRFGRDVVHTLNAASQALG